MNLTFKIRVNINDKQSDGMYNGYPIFNAKYNSHCLVLKKENDYVLFYKIPNTKRIVAVAATKANIKDKIKQYLANQKDDEAKELLKLINNENY